MISIVMTYFNRQAQLNLTLESFRKYDPKEFEVVIVDDGSDKEVRIPDMPFKITVIRMTDKTWTQGDPAYNAGIFYALQSNPDIIIIQNAECYHLGDILGYAKKNITDKNYITFGCYSQGKDEPPGSIFNNTCASFDGESAWYNHPVYRPKAYHFCAAISAKNMIKLNGFDERFSFGAGFDDDYLLHQIACLGLEIQITSDPIVIHQWHEHNPYRGSDEAALLNKNYHIFRELTKERVFRAKHLITQDFSMKTRFYIWVTSDCTLNCPYCFQKHTMKEHRGYQMRMDEVNNIVESCKRRGLHFDTIEITGGEASLWFNIRDGVNRFKEICDEVTLATNGNDPELIKSLGLKSWIVSESQATPEQMAKYNDVRHKLTINSHVHRKNPTEPIPDSLPASCCTALSPYGEDQVTFEYLKGKVYYCCDCFAHSEHVNLTDDLVCDFEDDFISKFSNKKYDKEICSYCLANAKIWVKTPETMTLEDYREKARR